MELFFFSFVLGEVCKVEGVFVSIDSLIQPCRQSVCVIIISVG